MNYFNFKFFAQYYINFDNVNVNCYINAIFDYKLIVYFNNFIICIESTAGQFFYYYLTVVFWKYTIGFIENIFFYIHYVYGSFHYIYWNQRL